MKIRGNERHPIMGLGMVFALGLIFSACGSSSNASSASSSHATTTSTSGATKSALPVVNVSYSSPTADNVPLYIAEDKGYFTQAGIDVKVSLLNASEGVPALVSGQTQLAAIGGSGLVSAAAAGAKLLTVGVLNPYFPFTLMSKYTSASQLKGQRIGVTSTSGSIYIGTMIALKQLGLSKNEVQIVPTGSIPNLFSAMVSGSVAAGLGQPPQQYSVLSKLHPLIDLAKAKIANEDTGIVGEASYINSHKKIVQAFMNAIVKAQAYEKTHEAYTVSEMSKYLHVPNTGANAVALQKTWKYLVNEILPGGAVPTAAMLQTSVPYLSAKAATVNLSSLVDASFAQKAEASQG